MKVLTCSLLPKAGVSKVSVKGQIVNISSSAGYLVTLATIRLCFTARELCRRGVNIGRGCVPTAFYL